MQLPLLRNDLELYQWEMDANGGEQWVIHDPLAAKFYSVSRDVIEILKRLTSEDVDEVIDDIKKSTDLTVTKSDVARVCDFVYQNRLAYVVDLSSCLKPSSSRRSRTLLKKILYNYIMFRVPLLRPDVFLGKTKKFTEVFYQKYFWSLSIFIGILGIFLNIRDWGHLERQINLVWSISGALNFAITLVFVKLIHEFAHAYTAKRYGARVPIMGITFILLFPLPYTDTTNSWKLSDHNQRLKIASAGIVSEFVLALWSTFLWKVSPEGALQNAFFFVATTTWISSLIVNASPFMRFDGYFLLMDFLKIPNLHARSTAMAKWWIRELLFKLNIQAPEIFSANMKVFLIIFAVTTWIYRFFVFLALALLVYHFFVKAIGVMLFLMEIYIFIIKPVYLEARVWWHMRRNIVKNRRVIFVLMALCLFGVFIAWPAKERHVVPALYMPYQEVTVYSPESGRVLSMPIDVGDDLEEGERLISLYSERIDYELRVAELAVSTAERDIQSENLSTGGIGLSGRNEAWSSALARLEALESEKQNLDVRAPMTGIVTEVFGEFHVNAFVSEGTPILRIQGEDKNQLRTYILENERSALKIGDQVSFFFNALPSQTFFARVSYISNVSTKALAYPELSSVNNGPMVSVETEGGYELDRQMFEAHFQVETPHQFTNRLPVTLNFSGDKQSYLLNLLQRAINLLIREFGA